MTTQQTILLSRLTHSPANVRRAGAADGIAELAASIAAHGLRQNLSGRSKKGGTQRICVASGPDLFRQRGQCLPTVVIRLTAGVSIYESTRIDIGARLRNQDYLMNRSAQS